MESLGTSFGDFDEPQLERSSFGGVDIYSPNNGWELRIVVKVLSAPGCGCGEERAVGKAKQTLRPPLIPGGPVKSMVIL